ncbi:hypothetical protein, partial [Escherichia coli]|uniref:hypothetical protein n=1 Tax=Escherichia coli TaxID=562 RepID=UPI003CE53E5C
MANTIEGIEEPRERRKRIAGSAKPDCMVIDVVDNGVKNDLNQIPKEEREQEPSLAAIMGLPP